MDLKPRVAPPKSGSSDMLFVTKSGTPKDNSAVNKAIKAAWAYYYSEKPAANMTRITSNISRRSMVTGSREHELIKADSFYECTKGRFNTIIACSLVEQMLFASAEHTEEADHSGVANTDESDEGSERAATAD